ncbi:MAG TPA: hypothetical protein PLP75_05190 [Burkholderiales bacterium]|jgi:hypothetical protein|nr:hypothetical protein [Burkholderiales bacterium]
MKKLFKAIFNRTTFKLSYAPLVDLYTGVLAGNATSGMSGYNQAISKR